MFGFLFMSIMDSHEEKLISKAAAGDGAAFSELMTMHEKRMYAVALRMCANREDAQDCLQDAMLRVYRSIGGFKGQSSFSTWVYRITMNTCLDELRRRKTRTAASLDTLLEGGWSPSDGENSPERHAVSSEQRRVLDKAIAELPEDMRSAIVLRDVQGFSYDEIADMLDVNIGTIKSRISRGREKLRQILRENAELFE
ncbi:MAG: sigma-70 family RNA polymerase sigma factor [Clostridia bacterium]|nr:sigma-70 family RNA polymerase sigma factor [Clostridia bacterium]